MAYLIPLSVALVSGGDGKRKVRRECVSGKASDVEPFGIASDAHLSIHQLFPRLLSSLRLTTEYLRVF